MLRKAKKEDIPSITAIYERNHDAEIKEKMSGWLRGIYPTEKDALTALDKDELYVWEENGRIVATGISNKEHHDVYAQCPWRYDVPDEEISVLHTLAVDPSEQGRGIGTNFIRAWEKLMREDGCSVVRFDTNAINRIARSLYKGLGYEERGIIHCQYNGMPDVHLVMLEKKL